MSGAAVSKDGVRKPREAAEEGQLYVHFRPVHVIVKDVIHDVTLRLADPPPACSAILLSR